MQRRARVIAKSLEYLKQVVPGATRVAFGRAASYVDKIPKGSQPGDLPIGQPTRFELVVNLRAAQALHVEIPRGLLVRADEVIE
ncbi:MAG TPA: ABC transporter substrate binding protein [Burkholderiaceae bacterium]